MGEPSPRRAVDKADAAISYAQTLLDAYGAVDVVDGAVKAGDVTLNDHTELVDAVKDRYGFGCTIFQGNVRIATTAVAAGGTERALGTSTNETITQQVFRNGVRFRGITRTIGKNWVIAYVPLRDHSGRIIGMIATYRELTEFLDDLELLDGTPEGVLLHTPDGRLRDVNRAACDMLGMSKRELLQKSIQEFTVGASHLDGKRTWNANTEPITVESRWHRADGHEFPVELSVGPATSAKASTLLIIARDFTERFAARERLRALNVELRELNLSLEEKVAERTRELVVARDAALQSEQSQRLILESSPIGVAIVSKQDYKRLYMNPRFLTMMGANSADELVSARQEDSYVDPKDYARLRTDFDKDDPIVSMEMHRKRLDGTLWWALAVRTAANYKGQDVHLNWHIDITDRKEAEKQLAEAKDVADAANQAKSLRWSWPT